MGQGPEVCTEDKVCNEGIRECKGSGVGRYRLINVNFVTEVEVGSLVIKERYLLDKASRGSEDRYQSAFHGPEEGKGE